MVVVPADWTPLPQPGPVIVIVTPDEESKRAIEVAQRAAQALEVELVVAHAIGDPAARVGPYYTGPQLDSMRAEHEEADHERMRAFLDSISCSKRVVSRMGDVRAFAAELTRDEDASLVFLGAHRRPLGERLLTPEFRGDLVAHLPVPVALIVSGSSSPPAGVAPEKPDAS